MVGAWRNLFRACLWCVAGAGFSVAQATDVALAGIFPGKVLLAIDGGPAKIVAVGQQTPEGVRVVSIEGQSAILEVDGKRRAIRMGESVVSQKSGSGPQESRLTADTRGHYRSQGMINGRSVTFLVDTGATMVSMGASQADQLGLDWRKGQPGVSQTANGQVRVRRVSLDAVRLGDIVLNGVDGLVHEAEMPYVLLGMSFLSRTEMRNEGSTLILKKRY